MSQSQLDSLSTRYQQLTSPHQPESIERCTEIASTRAAILNGCITGGKSIELFGLLSSSDECTPNHGLYEYLKGNVNFQLGNLETALSNYQQAIQKLGTTDQASVMVQLNLAASLNQLGLPGEGIDSLLVMLDPQGRWRNSPGIEDGVYINHITVNAAGMLISSARPQEALDLLQSIDLNSMSDYWRLIVMCNEYIANKNIKDFAACDSIWTSTLKVIPPSSLPAPMLDELLGSLLAANDLEYLMALRHAKSDALAISDKENSLAWKFILDQEVEDSRIEANWSIMRAMNASERERFSVFIDALESKVTSAAEVERNDSISELQKRLGDQRKATFNWQLFSLLSGSLLAFMFALIWRKEQKKRVSLDKALNSYELTSPELDAKPILKISKDELRKIHLGLTKGHQIAEALMALRKVELYHAESADGEISVDSIKKLPGVNALTVLEFAILLLTTRGVPVKEMAHQLNVSSGYIYNTRSSIRSKLRIEKSTSFNLWIAQQFNIDE